MNPLALSQSTAQACLSGLWQGLLLIALASLCLRLLPRLSPAVRFAVWSLVFTLAAVAPLLRFNLPASAAATQAASHLRVHPVFLSPLWGFAVAGLWLLLSATRLTRLALQVARLHRIAGRATPIAADPAIEALLITGSRRAQLCTSPDVDAPSVLGFFTPRLLLPAWLLPQLTTPELRQIILHECEHLRRRDDWLNLLQKLALALLPLSPALLWVDRRLSLERELACDAGVVQATAQPFVYAHCLTRLAEQRLHSRRIALTLSAWSRQSELSRRVHTLLRPVRAMAPAHARLAVALLSIGLAGGGFAMSRAPRLIAFTAPMSDFISAPNSTAAQADFTPAPTIVSAAYHPTSAAHFTLQPAVLSSPAIAAVGKPSTQPSQPKHRRTVKFARSKQSTLPTRVCQPAAAFLSVRFSSRAASATPTQSSAAPAVLLKTAATTQPPATLAKAPASGIKAPRSSPGQAIPQPTTMLPANFTTYAAVPFGNGWLIVQL